MKKAILLMIVSLFFSGCPGQNKTENKMASSSNKVENSSTKTANNSNSAANSA